MACAQTQWQVPDGDAALHYTLHVFIVTPAEVTKSAASLSNAASFVTRNKVLSKIACVYLFWGLINKLQWCKCINLKRKILNTSKRCLFFFKSNALLIVLLHKKSNLVTFYEK